MHTTDQLTQIVSTLIDTVDQVTPDQLNGPTPCADFTVHDLLDHMMLLGGALTYGFRGEDAPELTAPPVYGRVPAAEFREVMTDLLAAVSAPGALDRTITTPMGDMPGATLAQLVAFDGLVHNWDVAVATDQQIEYSEDLIGAVDEFARTALLSEMRDGDTFAAAIEPPRDATPLQRLVTFTGRSV